ncbi:MAG TPA: YetF domain-containing protein [Acidimicrobiales bacterium]|nr:YetF domain-containing protein [Acidimicrobiales bacterium]
MDEWLGASWRTVGYVVVGTVATYLSTIIAIRLAGRRTVAQLSSFDIVVTVAIGSLVASTAASNDPSYVQGMTALVTLLLLQVGIAALRQRSATLRRILDFQPETVVDHGRVDLPAGPLTSQITSEELRSKLRQKGVFDLDSVTLVVVEPTGHLSVSGRPSEELG